MIALLFLEMKSTEPNSMPSDIEIGTDNDSINIYSPNEYI